jgi:tetratricopeptide (TPR) repeat protein
MHALAIVNYARGFFIRAEELFLSAKTLDPQNAEIPYNLGILYYDAHRYKQTELEWLLSLKLNPSFGNAYLNLTYLYYEEGEFVKAWTNCQLALKQGIIVPNGLMKEIKSKLHV